MTKPIVLLAFANDWIDDRKLLRNLNAESKQVAAALSPLVERGRIELPTPVLNATIHDVLSAFRKPQYRDRICAFHFGGHANGSAVMFEDVAGAPALAHAPGLAGFLGTQRGLVLVFLNGCSTAPQVRALRAAGVKAVVATTQIVRDDAAAAFAAAFYAELATRPLQAAFDAAAQAVQVQYGADPRAVLRDIGAEAQPGATSWPWIIDCEPSFRAWRPRPKRGPYIALAAAAAITATLALSPLALHGACSIPGVRTACSAIGIGGIPSAEEQHLWQTAVARDDSIGLHDYLQRYPTGVYADEARARITACTTTFIDVPGAEQDIDNWPLAISPDRLRPFAAEDAARADALTRGRKEAGSDCASLAASYDVLSSDAVHLDWHCSGDEHGHFCGFDGKVLCHVRPRQKVPQEHCLAKP